MTPGRSCPLHYRYSPSVFAQPATLKTDALYIVGGLYGNLEAWRTIEALFGDEPAVQKQLVLNGDFHWFDVDAALFAEVESSTARHTRLRGNVETEVAEPTQGAGCGCAYPQAVDQGTVERSNRILGALQATAKRLPQVQEQLARLPMWAAADVGGLRVGLVHGDAESLAGWGFDPACLGDASHQATLARWFYQAKVDVFASSHTCAAGLHRLLVDEPVDPRERWVINNGAAGMPCFAGQRSGVISRIATTPAPASMTRLYGTVLGGVHIDAIAVPYDTAAWDARFLSMWPEGSDAHQSYWQRIQRGPSVPLGCHP